VATKTRNPTGDTSFTGTWTGSAGTRYQSVDDHPDSGNPIADGLTHGTATPGEGLFSFSVFDVPAGATAISLQVIYYDFKNASQACNIAARIRCNDTTGRDATSHNPGNGNANIALRTDNYANNPKSGAAWTVDDVNGVGTNGLTAFGVVSTDANPSITISSIIVQVTYTPPAIELAGTASLTLSSAAALTTEIRMVASAALTLSDAAALTTEIRMVAAADLALSSTAGLTTEIRLAAAADLVLSSTAGLTTEIRMAAAVTLVLDSTADLTAPQTALLEGAALLALSTAAGLTTSIEMAASASLALSGAGGLTTEIRMAGTAGLVLSSAAGLTTSIQMNATAVLALSSTAGLTTEIRMAAAAALVLDSTADLTTTGSALLEGTAVLALSSSAGLTTSIQMAAAAALALQAAGGLTTEIRMAGTAALVLATAGELTAGLGAARFTHGEIRLRPQIQARVALGVQVRTGDLALKPRHRVGNIRLTGDE